MKSAERNQPGSVRKTEPGRARPHAELIVQQLFWKVDDLVPVFHEAREHRESRPGSEPSIGCSAAHPPAHSMLRRTGNQAGWTGQTRSPYSLDNNIAMIQKRTVPPGRVTKLSSVGCGQNYAGGDRAQDLRILEQRLPDGRTTERLFGNYNHVPGLQRHVHSVAGNPE